MWRIASLCKTRGITLEVFELPCWKYVQNDCPDLILQNRVVPDNYNLTIHNLNNYNKCDTLFNPKKDWLSMDHLNYDGSIKLTNEIVRIITKQL